MTEIRNNNPEEKNVLHNWLEKLDEDKKKKFLRALGDHELMQLASSEDEYRMVTDHDLPDGFEQHKPLKSNEVDVPETTEELLNKRLEEILEAFPRSTDDLREMAEDEIKPKHSLDDLKKMGQPTMKIQISIEQMEQKANKL